MNKAKKVWAWIKYHWYVPILLILAIMFISMESGIKNKFYELLVKTRANYKKEIDVINKGKENEKEETVIVSEELLRWMTEGTSPNLSPRSDCG